MTGFESLGGPSYISSHSADTVLSEVRPIKLKLDALRCLNVFLDELLYKIISNSNSLTTERLKSGINKVLPKTLGKEAVLEAEVELKAYWERSDSESEDVELHEQTGLEAEAEDFDLQWSFEILRLKIEGYSTMNDTDEDAEAERRLNERMSGPGRPSASTGNLLAPAALYLTAVLEFMAGRVLSNVGRVASRDSSLTAATIQDLFVALCEDDAMYPFFKTMKVYDQIDSLSKIQKPRRSKSLSKGSVKSPARNTSITTVQQDIVRNPTSHLRASSESSTYTTSVERSRTGSLKFFNRSSSDETRGTSEDRRHLRDQAKNSNSFEMVMDDAAAEFDALVRSETTMKVSLTPDRLKTMEVFKQEKRRQRDTVASDASTPAQPLNHRRLANTNVTRAVEAIREDDEPSNIPTRNNSKPPPSQQSQNPAPPPPLPPPSSFIPLAPHARLNSLTSAQPPGNTNSNTAPPARSRSYTVSTTKKSTASPVLEPLVPSVLLDKKENVNMVSNVPMPPMSISTNFDGRPKRSRKVMRNRESLDLDDVMNGGGEDENDIDTPLPSAKRDKDPSKPYISRSARDLIDFLEQGPPEEPMKVRTRNTSLISLESSKSKAGRLQRMMSKLALGGSNERLSGKAGSDTSPNGSLKRKPGKPATTTIVINAGPISPPPTSIPPHLRPLNTNVPNVIVGTPPPPLNTLKSKPSLPTLSSSDPVTSLPSASASTSDLHTTTSGSAHANGSANGTTSPISLAPSTRAASIGRRMSVTRKAVPVWGGEGRAEAEAPPPLPVTAPAQPVSSASPAAANDAVNDDRAASPVIPMPYPGQPLRVVNGYPPRDSVDVVQPNKDGSIQVEASDLEKAGWVATSLTALSPVSASDVFSSSGPLPSPTPSISYHEKRSSRPNSSRKRYSGKVFGSEDARELRKLVSNATTADECRVLVDMFLTRAGFPSSALASKLAAFPSPPVTPLPGASASDNLRGTMVSLGDGEDDRLERSLVSALLGGEVMDVV